VARSADKEALVFVHGFNVDFAEAARRTAQLAYDLGFDGAPILYSWPSRGSLSPVGYGADTNSADWSALHLQAFLRDLASSAGATTVHLIAHSMGNRVLTQALRSLAAEVHAEPLPHFSQVVLTAPDIDAQTFRDQIAPAIRGTAERITLYASSGDEALEASKRVNGFPRAGDTGAGIVLVDGIDTIDVSAVDTSFMGHSYFAENGSVISDLISLLRDGKPPAERAGLVAVPLGTMRYWAFRR
jgi:esterase/lipase superfamily enzyme